MECIELEWRMARGIKYRSFTFHRSRYQLSSRVSRWPKHVIPVCQLKIKHHVESIPAKRFDMNDWSAIQLIIRRYDAFKAGTQHTDFQIQGSLLSLLSRKSPKYDPTWSLLSIELKIQVWPLTTSLQAMYIHPRMIFWQSSACSSVRDDLQTIVLDFLAGQIFCRSISLTKRHPISHPRSCLYSIGCFQDN